jgi:hypothetical protein
MSIISKLFEKIKMAGDQAEEVARGLEKEYEKNSTPSDTFLLEVCQQSAPNISADSTPKSHPLFPSASPSPRSASESFDPQAGLKELAFRIGRERHRVEKEEGASKAIPLLMIETRIALELGDVPTASRLSAHLLTKAREVSAAKVLNPLQAFVETRGLGGRRFKSSQALCRHRRGGLR